MPSRTDAKSLILDLLTSVRGHTMPVQALVAAGVLFDVRAESIRVALVRLGESGKVERRERGQYGIASGAQAVHRHVVAWDRLDDAVVPWNGRWIAVHSGATTRADRAHERRRRQAFALLGFREWKSALWVRPDNLHHGVDGVRRHLVELGLDPSTPVFALTDVDAQTRAQLASLWDVTALGATYRRMRDALERSAASLDGRTPEAAMVETYRLGGEAIRLVVFDPLLPDALAPSAERRALVQTMRRYDRLGRTCWRAFMRRHDAPHQHMTTAVTRHTEDLHDGHA